MSIYPYKIRAMQPATSAANAVPETVVGVAQQAGTITAANIIFPAAITGADATARTFTLYNRGTAGAGTTSLATLVTSTAGGVRPAVTAIAMTLSVVANALVLAAGDVLEMVETVAGAGTAHLGWTLEVTVLPSDG